MDSIKATIDLPGTFPMLIKKEEVDIPSFIKETLESSYTGKRKYH
jgi:hypothetical protein